MKENKNIQLLGQLEQHTGKVYLGTEVDYETSEFPANFIREFFENEIKDEDGKTELSQTTNSTRLRFLPELDSVRAEKILRKIQTQSHLPKTISDLAKVIGLAHSVRIWGLNDAIVGGFEDDYYFDTFFEDDYRITCAEDVHDYLIGRNAPDWIADELTEYISIMGWKGNLNEELVSCGCEEWFINVIERVRRLMSRAECYQRAIETKRLIFYLTRYPAIYAAVYDRV